MHQTIWMDETLKSGSEALHVFGAARTCRGEERVWGGSGHSPHESAATQMKGVHLKSRARLMVRDPSSWTVNPSGSSGGSVQERTCSLSLRTTPGAVLASWIMRKPCALARVRESQVLVSKLQITNESLRAAIHVESSRKKVKSMSVPEPVQVLTQQMRSRQNQTHASIRGDARALTQQSKQGSVLLVSNK